MLSDFRRLPSVAFLLILISGLPRFSLSQSESRVGRLAWTTKNLDTKFFANGDPIPMANNPEEWEFAQKQGHPAYCFFNFDPNSSDKFGLYYNGHAITDPRGLAPRGYKIPTALDFGELIDKLGGPNQAGKHLGAFDDWVGATDLSKLSFRKSGDVYSYRDQEVKSSSWWSSTLDPKSEDASDFLCLYISDGGSGYTFLVGHDGFSEYGGGYPIRLCRNLSEMELQNMPDNSIQQAVISLTEWCKKVGAQNKTINGKKEGLWGESYKIPKATAWEEMPEDSISHYRLIKYKAGLYDGWAYSYDENLKKQDSALYSNGTSDVVKFYPSGKKQSEYRLVNGSIEGLSKGYYEGGGVMTEISYQRGLLEGKYVLFRESGIPWMVSFYKKGKKDSISLNYDEAGKVYSSETYKMGLLNGSSKEYFNNGSLKREVFYQNGIRTGIGKEYQENGILKRETPYENGLIHGIVNEYNQKGQLEGTQEYLKGRKEGASRRFYPSGKVQTESFYSNGRKNGIEKGYSETGSLEETFPYQNGVINGISEEFYPSGKLKAKTPYVNGERSGVELKYKEDGSLAWTIEYKNDEKNGRMVSHVNSSDIEYIEWECRDGEMLDHTRRIVEPKSAQERREKSARSYETANAILSGIQQGIQSSGMPTDHNVVARQGIANIDAKFGTSNAKPTVGNMNNYQFGLNSNPNPNNSSGSAVNDLAQSITNATNQHKLLSEKFGVAGPSTQLPQSSPVTPMPKLIEKPVKDSKKNKPKEEAVLPLTPPMAIKEECEWCTNNCVRFDVFRDSNDSNKYHFRYANLTDQPLCIKDCWQLSDGSWSCDIFTVYPNASSNNLEAICKDPKTQHKLWVIKGKCGDIECDFPNPKN
jgi:uncharacterized protein (TIGR02145 family)